MVNGLLTEVGHLIRACEIRHAGNITFIPIKIKRSLLSLVTTESSQKDNMCVFECFNVIIFLSQTLICHKVVGSKWPLNRGKNNRQYPHQEIRRVAMAA